MTVCKFKFQGVNNDKAVFSIVSEGGWYHYKMDSNGKIERVSYADMDLANCNTTIIQTDGEVIESKAKLTSTLSAKGLLDTLIERDVYLEGLGDVCGHNFLIMKTYDVEVILSNGKTFVEKYDGVDESDAIRVAKVNNPLFESAIIK